MKKIKLLAVIMSITMVLGACSNGDTQSESNSNNSTTNTESSTTNDENTENKDEKRIVETSMGEKEVPDTIERITVMKPHFSDQLLALGITPTASVTTGPDSDSFGVVVEGKMDGVQNIGWQVEPNLEVILSTDADIILADGGNLATFENLDSIAPTFLYEFPENDDLSRNWKTSFLQTAELVDKTEEAEKVIDDFNNKAADAKEQIDEVMQGKNAMVLRITSKDIRYYSAKIMQTLYTDLGVSAPANFPSNESTFEPITYETLLEINPDYIFIINESDETFNDLKATPIWTTLEAVRNERFMEVDREVWFNGFGPTSNSMVIDDCLELLTR